MDIDSQMAHFFAQRALEDAGKPKHSTFPGKKQAFAQRPATEAAPRDSNFRQGVSAGQRTGASKPARKGLFGMQTNKDECLNHKLFVLQLAIEWPGLQTLVAHKQSRGEERAPSKRRHDLTSV